MSEKRKLILCIDFDGVIHSYGKGWHDGSIYGEVVPGFFEWAVLAKEYFALFIYSSRSKTPEGRDEMRIWMLGQLLKWYGCPDGDVPEPDRVLMPNDFEYAHEKPPAFLSIDDRAVEFGGRWDSPFLCPEYLREFKPWNAR